MGDKAVLTSLSASTHFYHITNGFTLHSLEITWQTALSCSKYRATMSALNPTWLVNRLLANATPVLRLVKRL